MPIADQDETRADRWLAQDSPDAEILMVGVPNSKASRPPSRADLAPLALRDRLGRFSTFHGEWLVDFSSTRVRDRGNWPVSELDMDALHEMVHQLAGELPDTPLTVFLGGDNGITLPLVASLADDLSRVGLIGFGPGHAPSSASAVRGLIEDQGLPGENVAQIGAHSFLGSAADRSYFDQAGTKVVTVEQVEQEGIWAVVDQVIETLEPRCDAIYLNVDMGVLDRAFAPGCQGARPGGMTPRQLAAGARLCGRHPKVKAADIVAVDPEIDRSGITLDTAANILLSMVAGYAER